jgi:hypothetical protein
VALRATACVMINAAGGFAQCTQLRLPLVELFELAPCLGKSLLSSAGVTSRREGSEKKSALASLEEWGLVMLARSPLTGLSSVC